MILSQLQSKMSSLGLKLKSILSLFQMISRVGQDPLPTRVVLKMESALMLREEFNTLSLN